jgi:hypothetical protein
MEIKNKYNIKDVVYLIYDNEIVCAKVYAIKIEIVSLYKKQLHCHGVDKNITTDDYYSYKVVCEETRCNSAMEEYFPEYVLYISEDECIKNIRRVK